jgi:hypothetical protein
MSCSSHPPSQSKKPGNPPSSPLTIHASHREAIFDTSAVSLCRNYDDSGRPMSRTELSDRAMFPIATHLLSIHAFGPVKQSQTVLGSNVEATGRSYGEEATGTPICRKLPDTQSGPRHASHDEGRGRLRCLYFQSLGIILGLLQVEEALVVYRYSKERP